MAETITKEEIQQEVQEEVKEVVVESLKVVKQYIDEKTAENSVDTEALKNEIADAIAQKYDFESEKEKLDKASEVAETLLGLFDTNTDGQIDPQEFLDKLNSIYSQLETTNKLSSDLVALAEKVGGLTAQIDAIKADLTTNYLTKEDVKAVLTINKEEIINEVNAIFYPASDDEGDGATL